MPYRSYDSFEILDLMIVSVFRALALKRFVYHASCSSNYIILLVDLHYLHCFHYYLIQRANLLRHGIV